MVVNYYKQKKNVCEQARCFLTALFCGLVNANSPRSIIKIVT